MLQAGLPGPIDAMAFMGRLILSMASSALFLENWNRNPPEEDDLDWHMDPEEIQEGKELPELGIKADSAVWLPLLSRSGRRPPGLPPGLRSRSLGTSLGPVRGWAEALEA